MNESTPAPSAPMPDADATGRSAGPGSGTPGEDDSGPDGRRRGHLPAHPGPNDPASNGGVATTTDGEQPPAPGPDPAVDAAAADPVAEQASGPTEPADTPDTGSTTGDAPSGGADEAGAPDPNGTAQTAPAGVASDVSAIRLQLDAVAASLETLDRLHAQVAELTRLRVRDADIVERLHADNTRLRNGELTATTAPLIGGLLRLHDQMTSLAAGDPQSIAGMLRTQLVQLLDTVSGVTAYEPAPGDPFDSTRHSGAGRAHTPDPTADGTVARTVRPGFARGDGTVVRVAEVEVYRHTPGIAASVPTSTPTATSGSDPQERP